jgi:hypothetical protein
MAEHYQPPPGDARARPQHHTTAGDARITTDETGAGVGVFPERPTRGGASPWQLQVTVGTTGDPRPEPFFGVPLEEVPVPAVLDSPHLAAVLNGLISDGNRQQDIWVRVGLNGQVDDYDWGQHEQRFAVNVDQDEFERLGSDPRYLLAMRQHAPA